MAYYSTPLKLLCLSFLTESTNLEKHLRNNPVAVARVMQNICRGVSVLSEREGGAIPERAVIRRGA